MGIWLGRLLILGVARSQDQAGSVCWRGMAERHESDQDTHHYGGLIFIVEGSVSPNQVSFPRLQMDWISTSGSGPGPASAAPLYRDVQTRPGASRSCVEICR